MTFTSQTEARFYLYLNGKLQNEQPSGSVTLRGLGDKAYHVRIVMDDPFEVAATLTLRPGQEAAQYDVEFNPVRERVYVTRAKAGQQGSEEEQPPSPPTRAAKAAHRHRQRAADSDRRPRRISRKERAEQQENSGTTGKDVKQTKKPIIVED